MSLAFGPYRDGNSLLVSEMALRESGKQRVARIATDFHQRADAVQRFRLRIVALCGLCTALYLIFGMGSRADVKFSRGPVAAVHAGWESECSVCHQDFVPISENAWATTWTNAKEITGLKCSECHATDGHHESCMIASNDVEVGCASCHQEHRGYDADLSRVHDRACLQCHSDLERVRNHSILEDDAIASRVTAFNARNHPTFRSLEKDPGTIRFDHRLHMSAGLVANAKDRGALAVKDLSSVDRKALGLQGVDEQALVQLNCGTCHQPDEENGRSMLPIRFNVHCAACHSLPYKWDDGQSVAPHGLQFKELETHFRRQFAEEFIRKNPEMTRRLDTAPAVPWKQSESIELQVAQAKRFVEDNVSSAIRTLKVRCEQCHELDESDRLAIRTPNIPSVWLRHAEFDHRSHRFVDCRECHTSAFSDETLDQPDHEIVMIAGRDRCIQCHTKTPSAGNSAARTDCVECHRYHVERDAVTKNRFETLTGGQQ